MEVGIATKDESYGILSLSWIVTITQLVIKKNVMRMTFFKYNF
jgi:hypothetical protein